MIAYLEGKIDRLTPTTALIECQGVGYEVHITLVDYTVLQKKEATRLWVTEIIREDAHLLFGFLEEETRAVFEKLCTVSGVGANTARLILSTYTSFDVASIIQNGEVEKLKQVKGIGLKTAQRIVVDLKGKIDLSDTEDAPKTTLQGGANHPTSDEALRALKMLGFPEANVRKVLKLLLEDSSLYTVEELIKEALKRL